MGILRLLLALAVVVSHSPTRLFLQEWMVSGSIAVQAFYIVSGFYMALVLNEKYTFAGSTRLFYQQRYLRLAPMYWVAVFFTIGACAFYTLLADRPVGKFEVWAEHGQNMSPGALGVLGLSQLTMFGLDAMMFCQLTGSPLGIDFTTLGWEEQSLGAVRFLLVPPAWSLSVELLFYLVAPFLVRRSVRAQMGIVAATFALRILAGTAFGLRMDPWDNRFFPFEAGVFLLGSLAYRALPTIEQFMQRNAKSYGVTLAIVLAALVCLKGIPVHDDVRRWGFVFLIAAAVPILFTATKRNSVDRWIGELSYPLYLLHQVTFYAFGPLFRRLDGKVLEISIIVLPVIVAVICYFLFERPFEKWRARLFKKKTGKESGALPATPTSGLPEAKV